MPLTITSAANAIGYKFSNYGQCYGIACMGIQSAQRDLDSTHDFINRINLIHTYENERAFVFDLTNSTSKYKILINEKPELKKLSIEELFKNNYIDDIDKMLLTMKAFFEGVAMYMGRDDIDEIFADGIGYPMTQNYIFPNKILNEHLNNENPSKGLDNGHEFTGILKREDISELLNINTSKKISYLFSIDDHAFSISCLGNNTWLTVDHDNVTVTRNLNNALSLIKKYSTANHAIYNVVTFGLRAKEKFFDKLEQNFIVHLEKYINDKDRNYDAILLEYFYLLFAYGPLETLKKSLDILISSNFENNVKIVNILSNNSKNGCSGFYYVLQQGCIETVNIFLDFILTSHLSENIQVTLLKALRVGDVPGFYMAMQHGYSATVDIFTKKILNSNLSNESKIELVNPIRKDKISGLYIILKDNHIKTAEVYLKNIISSNLENKFKMRIINNHASSNIYGLHPALLNNKKEFVNNYINIIIESELEDKFKHRYYKVKLLAESRDFLQIITSYPLANLDCWIRPLFKFLSSYDRDDDDGESTRKNY